MSIIRTYAPTTKVENLHNVKQLDVKPVLTQARSIYIQC